MRSFSAFFASRLALMAAFSSSVRSTVPSEFQRRVVESRLEPITCVIPKAAALRLLASWNCRLVAAAAAARCNDVGARVVKADTHERDARDRTMIAKSTTRLGWFIQNEIGLCVRRSTFMKLVSVEQMGRSVIRAKLETRVFFYSF